MEAWVSIGIVVRTHGVKGHIRVRSLSGETEHFFRVKGGHLRRGDAMHPFVVDEVQPLGDGDLAVKLCNVDTPEEAKKYHLWEVCVSWEEAAPLGTDEYYHATLCSCDLYGISGEKVGSVTSLVPGGGGDLLEVKRKGLPLAYVPFRRPFIGEIDLKRKRIELKEEWVLG